MKEVASLAASGPSAAVVPLRGISRREKILRVVVGSLREVFDILLEVADNLQAVALFPRLEAKEADNSLLRMAQAQNQKCPAWAFARVVPAVAFALAEIFHPDPRAQADPFFQNIRAFYRRFPGEA